MSSKKQEENPLYELDKAYGRWKDLYENGGNDPFYADGVNLNFVRNHIILCKLWIETEYPEDMKSELYQRPLPPEVDPGYMARAEYIREHARESLARYKADPAYQYLWKHRNSLTPAEKSKTYLPSVLGYVTGLELALHNDDMVAMRRYEAPDRYIESFHDCADRVREVLENQEPNLFTMAAEAESSEEEPSEISMSF